jgi:fatty-acyl-CoA synthase
MLNALRTWWVQRLLSSMTTPRDVARWAFAHHGKRLAVQDARRQLSYEALGQRCLRIAAGWRAMGLRAGDVVAVWLPDGVAQVEARLAAAECGAVLAALPHWCSTAQVQGSLQHLDARLLVHDGSDPAGVAQLCQQRPGLQDLVLADGQEAWLPERADPDDQLLHADHLASVTLTSGTTGAPKLLRTAHGTRLHSLLAMVAHGLVVGGDSGSARWLSGIALCGAGSDVLLPCLLGGACLLIPPRVDAGSLLDWAARHQVTRLLLTPSQLIDLLDHPRLLTTRLPQLKHILYGAECMPVAKLEEALRHFGPILQQVYGSAEVLPPVALLHAADHVQGDRSASRDVLMSCGKPVPGVSVRIVDEADNDLPPGQCGRVLVHSPSAFQGYLQRPALNATVLHQGYLRMGDVGAMGKDGRLTVLGRQADVLHRDDRTVYPRLIEEVAHDHPAIKEAVLVQGRQGLVLVFSLRRAHRGRQAARPWRDTLAQHLTTRLQPWQMPDDYLLLDELPRSPLGKVLRRHLREQCGLPAAGPRVAPASAPVPSPAAAAGEVGPLELAA